MDWTELDWTGFHEDAEIGKVLMQGNASRRGVAPTRGILPGTPKTSAVFLLGIALIGCRQSPREPVTLRYTYSWNEDRPQTRALLQQFTQETGIRVKSIPIPEYTRDYLELARKLLEDGSGADSDDDRPKQQDPSNPI